MVIYTLNFIDRQILSVLLPSIQAELNISDAQGGFLVGFAFALFYATLGMPIALLADRSNRRNLITYALILWSSMTALCGMAQNFLQLALARIGVGIGEAGCSPPAHSLLSDYYPEQNRATALSIYSLGIPLGIMFGLFLGGWINEWFGWRYALLVVGLPGIIVALIFRLTVQEPVRGGAVSKPAGNKASFGEALRYLLGRKTFLHLSVGAGFAAFAGYSATSWLPTFLARNHGMSSGEIGTWLGFVLGVPGGIGTFLGGYLADRFGRKDLRWRLWVIVPAFVIAVPFMVVIYLAQDKYLVLALLSVPIALSNFYLATSFAQTQNIAHLKIRAVAAAIMLFILNIIGLGAGPWLVGIASEWLAPTYGNDSLRYALLGSSFFYLWSAIHFVLAGRHLPEDTRHAQNFDG